jgi:hypothetical protein
MSNRGPASRSKRSPYPPLQLDAIITALTMVCDFAGAGGVDSVKRISRAGSMASQ